MNFRVLGCSGSELDRNHPCSFIVNDTILVDMGSAASRLTLTEQSKISDIVVSHAHLDHTKDIPFFAENVFTLVNQPVTVRSTKDTLDKIRNHLLNNQIWPDFASIPSVSKAILRYEAFEPHTKITASGVEIYAVPVNHPGGCVALFFKSPKGGTVLYTGDTGPTEEVWKEVNQRGNEIRAILLETSFPNRLQDVADLSGHHTPQTLAKEIQKLNSKDVPIYTYHFKAPYLEEIVKELRALNDDRIRFLEPGMRIEF